VNDRKESLNKPFVGSYLALSVLPMWATVAIFVALLLAIPVGRDITEGMMYNISYSSAVGDFGLMVAVLIAVTILKRGVTKFPRWLQSGRVQFFLALVSFTLGTVACITTIASRQGQVMDVYHDIVVAPLFLYLAITLLPIVFRDGTKVELSVAVFCILSWALLGWFDANHQLLNQRQWLAHHANLVWCMRYY